ncbi:MAG: hypothetical protein QOH86_174 [Sphingomonadales bacterium]|jgi:hypothetical protein|nr:hypothetical protein [Sphingomonadales bacterium]
MTGIATTRLAAAILMIAEPPAPPAAESLPEILTTDQALATFRQLCVDPLPSPQRFVEAMNGSGLHWRKVDKTPDEVFALGNSWRSARGMITYHVAHWKSQANPACHFEWRPGPGYGHAAVATALAAALGLDKGKNTGSRREPQRRWETTPGPDDDTRVSYLDPRGRGRMDGALLDFAARSRRPAAAGGDGGVSELRHPGLDPGSTFFRKASKEKVDAGSVPA